jgi:hypothetical protein
MSPIGIGGVYYAGAEHAARADVALQAVVASGVGAAFNVQDADSLLAKLTVAQIGDKEVQKVVIKATGGTFKLTYSGQQTTALKWNATAAEVQAALVALSNLVAGDIVVTGGPGDEGGTTPYILTFNLGADVAAVTAQTTLTGGEAKAEVSTTTSGSAVGSIKVALETLVEEDWYVVGEFPEVTAADPTVGKAFGPLGSQCRWKWTLGSGDGVKFSVRVSERK